MVEHEAGAVDVTAIVFGGNVGGLALQNARSLTVVINPVLGLLLFATFLGVPLIYIGRCFRDGRFLGTVLMVNDRRWPPSAEWFGTSLRGLACARGVVGAIDAALSATELAGRQRGIAAALDNLLAQQNALNLTAATDTAIPFGIGRTCIRIQR